MTGLGSNLTMWLITARAWFLQCDQWHYLNLTMWPMTWAWFLQCDQWQGLVLTMWPITGLSSYNVTNDMTGFLQCDQYHGLVATIRPMPWLDSYSVTNDSVEYPKCFEILKYSVDSVCGPGEGLLLPSTPLSMYPLAYFYSFNTMQTKAYDWMLTCVSERILVLTRRPFTGLEGL